MSGGHKPASIISGTNGIRTNMNGSNSNPFGMLSLFNSNGTNTNSLLNGNVSSAHDRIPSVSTTPGPGSNVVGGGGIGVPQPQPPPPPPAPSSSPGEHYLPQTLSISDAIMSASTAAFRAQFDRDL
ncbi:hypothetical protein BLOT_010073 [Blomia tropicalis]|nr:hypothetical protein BLOT_010073 [Blomia tropicalis]